MAEIPQVEKGIYVIRAERRQEPSSDLSPIDPPKSFQIAIKISNGEIVSNFIHDPNPGWGKFKVEKYERGILYLRNDFYPNTLWRVQIPSEDGRWTVTAVLR